MPAYAGMTGFFGAIQQFAWGGCGAEDGLLRRFAPRNDAFV
jgi:hypothetical protein